MTKLSVSYVWTGCSVWQRSTWRMWPLNPRDSTLSRMIWIETTLHLGKDKDREPRMTGCRRIYGRLAVLGARSCTGVDEELSRYYRLALCDMFAAVPDSEATVMVDPLAWWKEHQREYPRIAVLARRFLCIAPTSVPCERAFSKAGWIVNKRRCSLSDGRISSLVFVSSNRQYRSGL